MNIPMIDFHINTSYCNHGDKSMSVRNIIDAAERIGLNKIVLTEHITQQSDLAILKRLRDELERIKTNIEVIIGGEVEANNYVCDGSLSTPVNEIDFVTAATHYFPYTKSKWHEKIYSFLQELKMMTVSRQIKE